MELQDKYIRFDWAVKRLLRHKANFGVLEGFLTVLIARVTSKRRMISSIGLISKLSIVKMRLLSSRFKIRVSCIIWSVSCMEWLKPLQNISHWARLIIKLKRYILSAFFISILVMELIIFIMGRIYLKECIQETFFK